MESIVSNTCSVVNVRYGLLHEYSSREDCGSFRVTIDNQSKDPVDVGRLAVAMTTTIGSLVRALL